MSILGSYKFDVRQSKNPKIQALHDEIINDCSSKKLLSRDMVAEVLPRTQEDIIG